MEDNTKSVENKNNILMNKTKVQLVDIILRKDARERALNARIDSIGLANKNLAKNIIETEKQLQVISNKYNSTNKELEAYKRDYNNLCDKRIIECFNYNKSIKTRNNLIRVFSLVTVIELLLLIYYILQ